MPKENQYDIMNLRIYRHTTDEKRRETMANKTLEPIESNSSLIAKTINFALGQYSTPMSLLQIKLHAYSITQIQADEDPEKQKTYTMNIEDLSSIMGVNKRTLLRNLEQAADKLMEDMPVLKINSGSKTTRFEIFQSVISDSAKKTISIRYSYEFRKMIISMKSKYDLRYPVETILKFQCKYTIYLYNFLLAKIAEIRQHNVDSNNFYVIETTPDELLEYIPYQSDIHHRVSGLRKTAILPACEDLCKYSELHIENNAPNIIYQGKAISKFVFKIVVASQISLFPPISSISSSIKQGIPSMTYILEQLSHIGIDKSLLIKIQKSDPELVWRNLVYMRIQGKAKTNPRYFNACFNNNYAKSQDLEQMVRNMYNHFPEYNDDVIFSIIDYYNSLKPKHNPNMPKLVVIEPDNNDSCNVNPDELPDFLRKAFYRHVNNEHSGS